MAERFLGEAAEGLELPLVDNAGPLGEVLRVQIIEDSRELILELLSGEAGDPQCASLSVEHAKQLIVGLQDALRRIGHQDN